LGLRYGMASVIFGVGFIMFTEVGDPLDDECGSVDTGEGALGVGPILFGPERTVEKTMKGVVKRMLL